MSVSKALNLAINCEDLAVLQRGNKLVHGVLVAAAAELRRIGESEEASGDPELLDLDALRTSTRDSVDEIDAALFSGDEFISSEAVGTARRACLMAYLVRWKNQLERLEEFAAEGRKCGACNGTGRVVRDPDIGTDQECPSSGGSGVAE